MRRRFHQPKLFLHFRPVLSIFFFFFTLCRAWAWPWACPVAPARASGSSGLPRPWHSPEKLASPPSCRVQNIYIFWLYFWNVGEHCSVRILTIVQFSSRNMETKYVSIFCDSSFHEHSLIFSEVRPQCTEKSKHIFPEMKLCRACLHSFFIDCQSARELRITSIPRDAVI